MEKQLSAFSHEIAENLYKSAEKAELIVLKKAMKEIMKK